MIRLKKQITLALMGLLLAVTPIKAYASESTLDTNRLGSITITLQDNDKQSVISGASFTLYKVAEITETSSKLNYNLTKEFKACGEDLKNLDEDKLTERLAEYVIKNGLKGRTVDSENGKVTFNSLEVGLYMLVDNGNTDEYYPVSPFLISIPSINLNGTSWIYDINANPKVEEKPVKEPDPINFTVKKVWENKKGNTPNSVKVTLLCDDNIYDTVELSSKNGWKYTWSNLDATKEWDVKEIYVPKGYTASYERNENMVIITNAGSLIQTGQLIWPIPVLAGAGILIFAVGWVLFFGKRKDNHAK